jgi:hypothetical protein
MTLSWEFVVQELFDFESREHTSIAVPVITLLAGKNGWDDL